MEASRAKKKDRLKAEKNLKLPDDVEFLNNEIRLLRQEVKTAQKRAHAYNTMIDVAEEMYHIPIRKNMAFINQNQAGTHYKFIEV